MATVVYDVHKLTGSPLKNRRIQRMNSQATPRSEQVLSSSEEEEREADEVGDRLLCVDSSALHN